MCGERKLNVFCEDVCGMENYSVGYEGVVCGSIGTDRGISLVHDYRIILLLNIDFVG